MAHSHTTLKGHLKITLFNQQGQPIAQHENHNRVLLTGQRLLLNLLLGTESATDIQPLLGLKGFKPEKDLKDQADSVTFLQSLQKIDVKLDKNTLFMSFSGAARKADEIFGGGLLVSGKDLDGKATSSLYNFAEMENSVPVKRNMPMVLNFSLTVGD